MGIAGGIVIIVIAAIFIQGAQSPLNPGQISVTDM